MKDIIGTIGIVLLLILCIATPIYMFQSTYKIYEKDTKMYNSYLNEKIVLDKDTLTIIDYQRFSGILILSNGVKIPLESIDSLKIKK